MKRSMMVITLMLVSMILLACGSGGSSGIGSGNDQDNKFFRSESIGLSCAEATNTPDNICSGERQTARVALANGPVQDSVYNAGDISKSEMVYYELEATNGAFSPARLYIFIDESGAAGCAAGITTQTYPFDMNQRAHKNIGTSGTGYEICAVNGASWANVTIYNASHLALDMLGNHYFDEPIYTTTILWNFID